MRLISGDISPFLISDIRKEDLIPAPVTIVFPFNASYFGTKVEWMFLRPFLISDHQKEDLNPAPIMVGFPSDAACFWRQSRAVVSLPVQFLTSESGFNSSTNDYLISLRSILLWCQTWQVIVVPSAEIFPVRVCYKTVSYACIRV